MSSDALLAEFKNRHQSILQPLARKLVAQLESNLEGIPRIDRVAARAKSPDRFISKAMKTASDGAAKYADPFNQIQDLVGARIAVFYLGDVDVVAEKIKSYYRRIEERAIVPESANEFGYVGTHYILAVPEDLIDDGVDRDKVPQFFELQIKTLFQHAWSEAEHDIGYKPTAHLSIDQKRRMAFTAAQAWGADHIFQTLHRELGAQPCAI